MAKAPLLKSGGRKPLQVRVLHPPLAVRLCILFCNQISRAIMYLNMGLGLTKTYVLVVILSLGILSALSFGVLVGMETNGHGQMAACPFTMVSSLCTMSFSEHLSLWQSMFTANLDNGALLLILGFIFLAFSVAFKHLDTSQGQELKSYRFYVYKHSKNPTFDKLLELFSQGILNPKIYDLATL